LENELRNAVAPSKSNRLRPGILKNDADFPPIIRVDRRRTVRKGDPVAEGQSRPWPHLTFHTVRKLHPKARRHQPNLLRSQDEVFLGRSYVVSGRVGRGSGREWQIQISCESFEADEVTHWALRLGWFHTQARSIFSMMAVCSRRSQGQNKLILGIKKPPASRGDFVERNRFDPGEGFV
jgi:hypothetical protein